MPSTSTQSSNLDAATIQVAEMLSHAAYDSLNDLSRDPNIQQLEAQGWNPVPTQLHQTDSTDSYQGIAFYKTINGVVQVVIANRGTVPTSSGDLTMDYDIAHNIQPPSDSSAQAFYQDVVNYFTTQQGITNVNVIETGHSLGGQEADFVTSQNTTTTPTEAVTFDAPGIGPAAQSASSANAVNISNVNDIIHLAGGTYVGNETTVSAPASTLDSAVGQTLGLLLSPDSGMGMLVGGVLGNVVANHALNDIAGYLSADPALAGVDLSIYSADQINQAVVNALAAMTPSQYYAMSSVQRANFLEGVFSQYGSTGSSSGSLSTTDIQEAFTVVSSGPGAQTLAGSVGDSVTLSSSGSALTSTASNGYTDTESFDATTGALISDAWKNAIGTKGADTYAADGSSTGTVTYADGNYATTLDDGQGNITTDYYTKDGIEIRSTWVHSDGSSGTVNLFGDGNTLIPGGGAYDVPSSISYVLQNPDGSYTTEDGNENNATVTTSFASNGSQTSKSTSAGTGVNDLTVASSKTGYAAGEEITYNYNASGTVVGDSWYAANPDGTVNPNGVYLDWAQATASSGSTVDNASGVIVKSATALDGSQYRDTHQLQGDTVSHLTASGTLLSDNWTITDGSNTTPSVTGSDTFNADGSGQGTFSDVRDGSAGTVTLNGQGDIVVVNTNASGTVTSEDTWNASTDSYTIATLSGSGTTLDSYDYLANGNVIATDYAPDGTTVADQQTVGAGLVVNPDGSSFSKVMNADGSYTVYYLNASGDTTAYQYSASGQLTGSYHTSNFDWPRDGWSGTFTGGSAAGTPWTSPHNPLTPIYTDAQGTTWTEYLNAAGAVTGVDYVNSAKGTHGYITYGADGKSYYETDYAADGSSTVINNDGKGDVTNMLFDAAGNETGDAWQAADGSHGGDTYKADGSSSGTTFNADGSASSYTDDGKGDIVTADYSAAGVELSQTWTNADGTSGNETFNADGSTVTTSYNADGSYYTTNDDGKGDIFQTDYTASGVKTGDAWKKADGTTGSDYFFVLGSAYNLLAEGQTTHPDGSSSQYQTVLNSSNLVETDTTFYTSGGVVSGTSVEVNNGNGTATVSDYAASGALTETMTDTLNSAGAVTSDTWAKSDGTSGSDTFNADGSSSGTILNTDGSYSTYTNDGKGAITTDSFKTSGVLSAVAWSSADPNVTTTSSTNAAGSVTTTSTNAEDHSSIVTTTNTDGSSVKTISDGKGDTTTDNYTAAGVLTSDAWTKADGTSGSDTYNADGSSSSKTVNADGSYSAYTNDGKGDVTTDNYTAAGVLTSDTWTKTDGSSGSDTYNADGSSSGKTVNADGSYSTYTNDGKGDVTTDNYSAAGVLTGQTTTGPSSGKTVNPDGSYSIVSINASTGQTTTDNYTAAGVLTSDTWTKTDGSSGSDTYNTDGSSSGKTVNADGSYSTYANDGKGDVTTDNYTAAGVLTSDAWTKTDGSSGSDTYNTDGSSSGKTVNADASYSTYTNDGKGDVTTDNYTAAGVLTGMTLVEANGSKAITTYNTDGSYVTTTSDTAGDTTTDDYTASGIVTSDVWKAAAGASGTETNSSSGALNQLTWSQVGGISGNAHFDASTGSYDILATGPSGSTYTESIRFSQSGTDLVATVGGTNTTLTAQGWGQATNEATFVASDGQLLGGINVEQLIQAMAGFTPPTSAQSAYMTQEAAALAPILAASWQ